MIKTMKRNWFLYAGMALFVAASVLKAVATPPDPASQRKTPAAEARPCPAGERLTVTPAGAARCAAAPERVPPFFVKDAWDPARPDLARMFPPLTVTCAPPLAPFAVTVPGAAGHWETCARNRLGALTSLAPTSWTKREWDDARGEGRK
jgi:hypothetical protein